MKYNQMKIHGYRQVIVECIMKKCIMKKVFCQQVGVRLIN